MSAKDLINIATIDVQSVRIPTIRDHEMAIGTTTQQENVVVALTDVDGNIGYGEAPHMVGHSQLGETPGTVRVVLRDKLIPPLVNGTFAGIQTISAMLDKVVPMNLRAKGALVMAIYDLLGKRLGVSASVLLGGPFRDTVPLSWSLPIQDGGRVVAEAVEMKERGWRILKVKVGRGVPDADADVVQAVREAVGAEMDLRVDANQAYDVKSAIRFADLTAHTDLTFFEQPVAQRDLRGMAQVRSAVRVPIMADESATDARDVVDLSFAQAADCISIYVIGPGGLNRSMEMATITGVLGMKGYVGGALESSIGACAGLHLAASAPSIVLGCEMTGLYLLSDSIAEEPIPFENGELRVPTAPGLGVEVSREKLGTYRVGDVEHFSA